MIALILATKPDPSPGFFETTLIGESTTMRGPNSPLNLLFSCTGVRLIELANTNRRTLCLRDPQLHHILWDQQKPCSRGIRKI